MRVALACPYDLSLAGGVQTQVLGLASALAGGGHEVLVLAPLASTPLDAPAAGVELVGVGRSVSVAANGSRAPVAPGPLAARRVLRAIRRFCPDVVHLHEPLVPAVCLVALARTRAPVVATFHRAGAGPGYRAFAACCRPLARRIALATAVSQAAASTARALLGTRREVRVVPNGVDVSRFTVAARSEGRAGIAFVGRLEERKGLGVLLEAFGDLERGARLDVAGSGPLAGALATRAAGDDRVRFLGQVSRCELVALLTRVSVVVAPSRWGESFGVVLLEAMAAGAAVVASDLPGYREAAGNAARFVPPDDRRALAEALGDLLSDGPARERLRAAGSRWVARFDFAALGEAYAALYDEAIADRRAAGGSSGAGRARRL